MPDLAVEIKSPNDTRRELRQKAERYLKLGTRMVWLVFPDEREVEVYVHGADVILIRDEGIIDGRDVLPGFTLPVAEVFS